jgi:hypothetical protein
MIDSLRKKIFTSSARQLEQYDKREQVSARELFQTIKNQFPNQRGDTQFLILSEIFQAFVQIGRCPKPAYFFLASVMALFPYRLSRFHFTLLKRREALKEKNIDSRPFARIVWRIRLPTCARCNILSVFAQNTLFFF